MKSASQTLFVGYGQFLSAVCAAAGQDATSVGAGHSGAETMLVGSFSVRGLERSFHISYVF